MLEDLKFVSHEAFPGNEKVSEAVTFEGEWKSGKKFRVSYIRRNNPKGGKFWEACGSLVNVDGGWRTFKFSPESTFVADDIRDYLEKRKWETSINVEKSVSEDSFPF